MRVAVIGGGVVGLCSAFALDRAGCEVVLLERGALGQGASRGNTGWVSPTLSTPLASPGTLRDGAALGARPARRARDPPRARHELAALAERLPRGELARALPARREGAARPQRAHLPELDGYAAAGVEFELHDGGIIVAGAHREGHRMVRTASSRTSSRSASPAASSGSTRRRRARSSPRSPTRSSTSCAPRSTATCGRSR